MRPCEPKKRRPPCLPAACLLGLLLAVLPLHTSAAENDTLAVLPGSQELHLPLDGDVIYLRGNVFSEGESIVSGAGWEAPELVFTLTRPLRAGEEAEAFADGIGADGSAFSLAVRLDVSRIGVIRSAAEAAARAWEVFLENGGSDPDEVRGFPLYPLAALAPPIDWREDAMAVRVDDVPGAWRVTAFDGENGSVGLPYRRETDDYSAEAALLYSPKEARELVLSAGFPCAKGYLELSYTYRTEDPSAPPAVFMSFRAPDQTAQTFSWFAEWDGEGWHTTFSWKGAAPPRGVQIDYP